MNKSLLGIVAAGSILATTSASALPLLEIVASSDPTWASSYNLTSGGVGAVHDVAVTQGQSGWYGANLLALQNVDLTFTYLGKEAGWTNALLSGGNTIFSTASAQAGQTASGGSASLGSWIDFTLKVLSGGNSPLSVTNGSNTAPIGVVGNKPYGAPNFWLGYVNGSQNSVYVGFDDGGGYWNGAIDDDDHDDLVFMITAVSVPEPSALILLGGGLLLVGFTTARRRRNSEAA